MKGKGLGGASGFWPGIQLKENFRILFNLTLIT
jgi:hypothetical protein